MKTSLQAAAWLLGTGLFCATGLHAQTLGSNLSLTGPGAGADGSGFSDTKLVRDGSINTYTQASGTVNQRVSVKWSSAQTFNTVILRESGNRITNWQLVNNDTGAVLATGTGIGAARTVNLGSVSMKKINLIANGSSPLQMAEIEVYNATSTASSSSATGGTSSAANSSAAAGGVNLTGSAGNGQVALNWTVTPAINAQEIYIDTDSDPAGRTRIASPGTSVRTYTATGLNNGTNYWFWVKYRTTDGVWHNSNAFSATPVGGTTSSSSSSSSSATSSTPSGGTGLMSCSQANTVRGFAALGGGTTGGEGGTTVTVTTGAQLVAALATKKNNPTPLKIYVNGTITPANSGGANQFDVKDMANVSILGVGSNALFDGIGINIVRANNIIVRNVKIRYNRIGQKDAVSIQGTSKNVWIDHNEFHNSLDVNKDYYDELVSGKNQIDNITISYNYLHDSWKTSLWGSGDSDSYDRRVTFVGNRLENVNSRLPLFRFGQAHVYNNYYLNVLETGINSRMGARIRIEGNYFENVKNPILSKDSSQIGYWDLGNSDTNAYVNVNWEPSTCSGESACVVAGPGVSSTVNYTPPYSYSVMTATAAKTHVLNNAGVGKLSGCL
ncbi:pectate lyase family protein [Cellvibrio japonicus]|nr:pectate lyase [Cellvibrio japonicus]